MAMRLATIADAEAIERVRIASWKVAYRGLIPVSVIGSLEVQAGASAWRDRLAGDSTRTLVAEAGGRVVGFVRFGASRDGDVDPADTAEIMGLYVDPRVWGSGYGRGLCDQALDMLKADGFAEVTLWVLEDNARARRFYESVGFAPDGSRRTQVIGEPVGEVRYRMRVETH